MTVHYSIPIVLVSLAASALVYGINSGSQTVLHFYGNGPLVSGRVNPIVSPGVASGHVHVFQGGNAFSLNMTDTQLLSSTCTSALFKNDKSNYWTPTLYFQDPVSRLLEDVQMDYMNVYYK